MLYQSCCNAWTRTGSLHRQHTKFLRSLLKPDKLVLMCPKNTSLSSILIPNLICIAGRDTAHMSSYRSFIHQRRNTSFQWYPIRSLNELQLTETCSLVLAWYACVHRCKIFANWGQGIFEFLTFQNPLYYLLTVVRSNVYSYVFSDKKKEKIKNFIQDATYNHSLHTTQIPVHVHF